MAVTQGPWRPTAIRRLVRSIKSAADTIEVITDQGRAYVKALGNHNGPHILACELVGTELARWFGLSTFQFALIEVTDDVSLRLASGGTAQPGPAFATRGEEGLVWSGDQKQLRLLVNPEDIPRLVAFDTWTLNWDRYPPDSTKRPNRRNVFLSRQGSPAGRYVLKAIDHTHCFTGGGDLTGRIAQIDRVRDDRLYGCFPEFRVYIFQYREALRQAAADMAGITRAEVERIVESVPREWEVEPTARRALAQLILDRASFVSERLDDSFGWRDVDLPLGDPGR